MTRPCTRFRCCGASTLASTAPQPWSRPSSAVARGHIRRTGTTVSVALSNYCGGAVPPSSPRQPFAPRRGTVHLQLPSFPTTCSPPPLSFPDERAVFMVPRSCAATADGSVVYVTEGAIGYRGGWRASSSCCCTLHTTPPPVPPPSSTHCRLPYPATWPASTARLCSAGP